jgi:hypothetical protein
MVSGPVLLVLLIVLAVLLIVTVAFGLAVVSRRGPS